MGNPVFMEIDKEMGDRGEQYIVIIGDEGSKEKENMGKEIIIEILRWKETQICRLESVWIEFNMKSRINGTAVSLDSELDIFGVKQRILCIKRTEIHLQHNCFFCRS